MCQQKYEKVYRFINNSIAKNSNLQKEYAKEKNLSQTQSKEMKRKKTLIVIKSRIKHING